MRKTNTKTSLQITLNPDGSALTNMKWADLDAGHFSQASERVIAALADIPDYQWLRDLIDPYLHKKYCEKCKIYNPTSPCGDDDPQKPFPYCFSEVEET